jgi:uncharacterized membrane protein YgcG
MTDDPLGPDLEARLRAELDRVRPPLSSPRYLSANPAPAGWRLAPAVLAAGVISILALSASVATGSPNPAVWGHDVVTIIQSSSTTPTPTPPASSTPTQEAEQPEPSRRGESPEPTEQPEPTEPADSQESPEPSGDHSGEGSGSGDGGGGGAGADAVSGDGGSGGGDSPDGATSDSDGVERS